MSDQPTPGFPRELLDQPMAVRRRSFETKVVAHQRLKEVQEALLHAIGYPAGTSLILLMGPPGVGKTTLLQRVVKQWIVDAAHDPTATSGHMPVSAMPAPSPDSGNFRWKDDFTRALLAAEEPMMASKISSHIRGMPRDEQGQLIIERTVTTPDLRHILEPCLLHRRPRAFIVDEAQHCKKMASGRRLLEQMDTLKSLSQMTQTVPVLVGTHELLGLMTLSAQLARRSLTLQCPRYRAESQEDLKEFKTWLRTFQRHLPLSEEPDLVSHYEQFSEHCLGGTGMLKTLLNRTRGAALEQREPTLTQKRWERHAEPPQKLKDRLQEIKQGEKAFRNQEDETPRSTLRELLGLSAATASDPLAKARNPLPSTEPTRAQRRRVGQRQPKRDAGGKESEHGQ